MAVCPSVQIAKVKGSPAFAGDKAKLNPTLCDGISKLGGDGFQGCDGTWRADGGGDACHGLTGFRAAGREIRKAALPLEAGFESRNFMVGDAGFLIAHDMAFCCGEGVEMFVVAGAVLNMEQKALGVMFHVDPLAVRRRRKGILYGMGVDMGRSAWGKGFRAGRFREDRRSGIRFNPLFHKLIAGQKDGRSECARCA